jgi:hypothetical protein
MEMTKLAKLFEDTIDDHGGMIPDPWVEKFHKILQIYDDRPTTYQTVDMTREDIMDTLRQLEWEVS